VLVPLLLIHLEPPTLARMSSDCGGGARAAAVIVADDQDSGSPSDRNDSDR
jgi:hypothetical protein